MRKHQPDARAPVVPNHGDVGQIQRLSKGVQMCDLFVDAVAAAGAVSEPDKIDSHEPARAVIHRGQNVAPDVRGEW